MRLTYVFDLDETCWLHPTGTPTYDDAASLEASCEPCPLVLSTVRSVAERGHHVAYLSGRCEGVRGVTERMLQEDGFPEGPVFLQVSFQNLAEMARWKASILRAIGADVYVGDTKWDALAAEYAEVPYQDVHELRAWIGEVARPRELELTTNGGVRA